jgi:hypothetical protein
VTKTKTTTTAGAATTTTTAAAAAAAAATTTTTTTIDRKTRKTLTVYKMHHPKADTDRLYVKRKEG